MKIKLMSIEPRIYTDESSSTDSAEPFVYLVTENDTIWYGKHLEGVDSIHFKPLKISFDLATASDLTPNSL